MATIEIPNELLPADGRFGCGPSKVRPESVASLLEHATDYLGTSHRQATVRDMVKRLRQGVAQLLGAPDGYEVILGNGGSTAFWDIATFCLIDERSQHCSFGEFSSKFGEASKAAPHLGEPEIITSEVGTRPTPIANSDIDLYGLTHNETSTGVQMDIRRPRDANGAPASGLVAVDATSAAGGLRFDPNETDVYYFAPQKCLGSDGGLWLALMSPAAIERSAQIKASGRWVPAFLDLEIAIENSRLEQTYNTPALATILLAVEQIEWFNANGGLEWSASRSDRSAETIYGWAERSAVARPFVEKPDERSHVVATIDFDDTIDAAAIAKALRANGVVDTEPYRKLGRNQLRVGMFPGVDPADVEALTGCIDYVLERLD
jgi:phosphoserine aminotransferase